MGFSGLLTEIGAEAPQMKDIQIGLGDGVSQDLSAELLGVAIF
jgi:hypothetical protein